MEFIVWLVIWSMVSYLYAKELSSVYHIFGIKKENI